MKLGDKCLYPQKSAIFVSINIYRSNEKPLVGFPFFTSFRLKKSVECLRLRHCRHKKKRVYYSSFSKTTFMPISQPFNCLFNSSTLSEKLLFNCSVSSSSFEISLLNLRYLQREFFDSLSQF